MKTPFKGAQGIALLCMMGFLSQGTPSFAGVEISFNPLTGGFRSGSSVFVTWDNNFQSPLKEIVLFDGERNQTTVLATDIVLESGTQQCLLPYNLLLGSWYRIGVRDKHDTRKIVFSPGFHAITAPQPAISHISDVEHAATAYVQPVPVQQKITVSWPISRQITRLILNDQQGQIITTVDVPDQTNRMDIDVAGITAGMYYLMIRDGNGPYSIHPIPIVR